MVLAILFFTHGCGVRAVTLLHFARNIQFMRTSNVCYPTIYLSGLPYLAYLKMVRTYEI